MAIAKAFKRASADFIYHEIYMQFGHLNDNLETGDKWPNVWASIKSADLISHRDDPD